MSARTQVLDTGRTQLKWFATELRRRARSWGMVCVRVTPAQDRGGRTYVTVSAWSGTFQPIRLTEQQQQAVVDALYDRRTDIDWRKAHQYDLETGRWSVAPEPHERGFIPSDDQAFGGGNVVFLATPSRRNREAGV